MFIKQFIIVYKTRYKIVAYKNITRRKIMNDYILFTDSCVDLPDELAKNLDLNVLPLAVEIEGKTYLHYLDERELNVQKFYQLLRERKQALTAQINAQRFLDEWTPLLTAGKDILYISFSAALSGTYNSAILARNELLETYPDRKLVVIDSKCASMGEGLLVTYAARLKKEGASIEEVEKWVEDNKTNICHLFTVGDLNHLKRGGRLSYSKALLGTILRVKPLLHVSLDGKLVQTGMTRGRKGALDAMIDRMFCTITNPKGQTVYISHGDCLEDAEYVKKEIMNRMPIDDVVINYIGPVIGSHSGNGTLAIFYMGQDRYKEY
jgi:DegV family protein with EDD domain